MDEYNSLLSSALMKMVVVWMNVLPVISSTNDPMTGMVAAGTMH